MIRTALSLALIALIATSAAFARQGGAARGNPLDRMAQELNLTAEQKAKLTTIFQAQREKMKARHEAMEGKLRSILTPEQQAQLDQMKAERQERRKQAGANPDHQGPPPARDGQAGPGGKHRGPLAQLNLTEEQKAQLKAYFEAERPQMQADRKAFRAEVEAVLTPEQRAQLQQKLEERRSKHPGHGKGGPQQPGPGPQQAPPQQPSNDGDSNF